MIRLFLFISILLIGLSMAITKNNWKFRQFSRSNEQIRSVRNLMGKLIDTDTNTIYTVDGQKQEDKPSNPDATTPTTVSSSEAAAAAPKLAHMLPNLEETACIAACHACIIEDHSLEIRKKRAADNCGPMCDCADSCLLNSAEEVGQVYGQNSNIINDKNCWWRTYTEILGNGLPSLP